MKLFDNKELDLLKKAGINIDENKSEYTINDKKYIFSQITEFIMSHSSKNGDIQKSQNDYNNILNKLV